ncbi:hypothetical protein THAOC_22551 [Thalassiosira oceanica]|uniref:RRM domain-containing protein n=1 Tax=Thalassiosira oceanica TaxID=159749 RepID=K0SFJ6_THAOC|nr:hypothetical protein THAOC_22551 [Thalassiosira oceanica]|eukprot:EJK57407.1 hypothetical protein THAOC_22551 [Thalassiosira oceanica]
MTEEKGPRGGGGGKTRKAADPRTLFVRFAPPSASVTRQHLSDHFSDYGPVGRCSVIRQQNRPRRQDGDGEDGGEASQDRGTRGFGFVRFVNEDDAAAAAEAIRKKQRGGRKGGGEVMVVDGVRYRIFAERAVDADAAPGRRGRGGDGKRRESAPAPPPAEITPAKTDEAPQAPAGQDDHRAEARRKRTSRVIVRNLSFHAGVPHVRAAMEKEFGPVAAVDLPGVPGLPGDEEDGGRNRRKHGRDRNGVPRHRGFAFVTFTNANAARMAVERGTEVSIKGRRVAIDFSVSKNEHRKIAREEEKGEEGEEDASGSSSGSDSEDDDGSDSESGEEGGSDDGSSSSDDDDDDGDSESDGEDDEKEDETSQAEKETPSFDPSESSRTLFLRNVPFDATRHDVFELFRKFGRIEAVHLVKDRATGVFKGTAFVRFQDEGGSGAAVEASGGAAAGTTGRARRAGPQGAADPRRPRRRPDHGVVPRRAEGRRRQADQEGRGEGQEEHVPQERGTCGELKRLGPRTGRLGQIRRGVGAAPPRGQGQAREGLRRQVHEAAESALLHQPQQALDKEPREARDGGRAQAARLRRPEEGRRGRTRHPEGRRVALAGGRRAPTRRGHEARDGPGPGLPSPQREERQGGHAFDVHRAGRLEGEEGGLGRAARSLEGVRVGRLRAPRPRSRGTSPAQQQPRVLGRVRRGGRAAAELAKRRKGKGGKGRKGKGGGGRQGADGPEGEGDFVGEDGRVLVPRLIVEFAVSC